MSEMSKSLTPLSAFQHFYSSLLQSSDFTSLCHKHPSAVTMNKELRHSWTRGGAKGRVADWMGGVKGRTRDVIMSELGYG